MTSKEAASKRIRELEEELEGHRKKAKSTSDSVAAEYTCSLSLELFVDPVRAEDGLNYERADIERVIKHQGKNLTSPQTGKTMGSTLTPSYNVKNAVEALVTTGTISGEHAKTYKNSKLVMETKQKAGDGDAKSMELLAYWYKVGRNGLSKSQALSDKWRERAEKADDDEYITELKASASDGDTAAMYNLGNAYENGLRGLGEDEEKAFEWYSKAADGMDTAGIAMKAYFLVNGHGVAEANVAYGTSQMFYAAGAGSDLASREVGIWYLHGMHDIPANIAKARYFLDRATNGLCAELHMKPADLEEAKQLLNQLDLQREEKDTDPLPPTSPSIGGRPMKKKSSRRTPRAKSNKSRGKVHGQKWTSTRGNDEPSLELGAFGTIRRPSTQTRRSRDKRAMNQSGKPQQQWEEKDPIDMTDDHEGGAVYMAPKNDGVDWDLSSDEYRSSDDEVSSSDNKEFALTRQIKAPNRKKKTKSDISKRKNNGEPIQVNDGGKSGSRSSGRSLLDSVKSARQSVTGSATKLWRESESGSKRGKDKQGGSGKRRKRQDIIAGCSFGQSQEDDIESYSSANEERGKKKRTPQNSRSGKKDGGSKSTGMIPSNFHAKNSKSNTRSIDSYLSGGKGKRSSQ